MSKVKPISGAQQPLPPLPPNDVQEECICVPKVYDWVLDVSQATNKFPVPDDCLAAVEEAIANGQAIDVTCTSPAVPPVFPISCASTPPTPGQPNCRVIRITRTTITVNGTQVPVAVVRLSFTFTVTVEIFADGVSICAPFPVNISVPTQVVLCLPEPLDENNIICRITQITCDSTGEIFDGLVELEVTVCAEIQVEAEVKLAVLAKFCQPRPPIPVPTPAVPCPTIDFPPQCPELFPRPNCECQGEVVATSVGVGVTLNLGAGAVTEFGDLIINANICPACTLSRSALTLQFNQITTPPYTPPPTENNSFTFTATSFNEPAPCVDNLELTVTGMGLVSFSNGTQQQVAFTLVLVQTPLGLPDTYAITLVNTITGVTLFASGSVTVPAGQLVVRHCAQFPPTT
ncbi:BMQ_0737 family morphogenetic spore coat protein [Numidum massiliense]|uniref:hypothetical protein n=1 Tax=Numidum massiliense TaxID=1522315 RepID=UPI0006D5AE4C|nr:hypothetical protein [Numidum massiliense]